MARGFEMATDRERCVCIACGEDIEDREEVVVVRRTDDVLCLYCASDIKIVLKEED